MPNFLAIWSNNGTTVPNTAREETMWSPDFNSPNTVAAIAAMPVAVATQASAPSSAARRSWNMVTFGLVKRL